MGTGLGSTSTDGALWRGDLQPRVFLSVYGGPRTAIAARPLLPDRAREVQARPVPTTPHLHIIANNNVMDCDVVAAVAECSTASYALRRSERAASCASCHPASGHSIKCAGDARGRG